MFWVVDFWVVDWKIAQAFRVWAARASESAILHKFTALTGWFLDNDSGVHWRMYDRRQLHDLLWRIEEDERRIKLKK
jgi:hypothetical protein